MQTLEEIPEKRPVGRPKTLEETVTTAFVLTRKAEQRLSRYCEGKGISRSEAVRQWIDTLPPADDEEQA